MKESMKTRNIVMTLLAGAAMVVTSCNIERENDFDNYSFADDEVAFKIGKIQTRSAAEAQPMVMDVATIKAGHGEAFNLEESVSSLDYDYAETAVTRGTPAFTENVTKVYPSSLYVVAVKENGSAAFTKATDLVNGVAYNNERDNVYSHRYGEDIWEGKLPTDFFMRMPGTNDGVTLGDSFATTYSQSEGSISFTYKSPATAANQKDILFSWYQRTSETNCEDVTFYHALTGIKFANFYTNKGIPGAEAITKTIIKEVTLTGVADEGNCKMVLKDATSSKTAARWSNVSGNATFTLSHSDTTDYKNSSMGLDTLLNATGKARNINKEDGSLTFWVVPQAFKDSTVMIQIKCDLELVEGETTKKTVTDTTITVSLGARTWQAGELHTFTLKPIIVGVELEDHMTDYEKSNVRVDNTGNVFEYVRVNLIGNWVGKVWKGPGENDYEDEDVILMGYTTSDTDDHTEVEFWNDKDGLTHYGEFVNLTPKSTTVPAPASGTVNNWVRYDKYYYYTLPIGPNDAITDQLFQKYTVGPSPEFWITDVSGTRRKAKDVHLIMDLMVQAIPAPVDENGQVLDNTDGYGYIRAWLEALDFEPTEANYSKLLDL